MHLIFFPGRVTSATVASPSQAANTDLALTRLDATARRTRRGGISTPEHSATNVSVVHKELLLSLFSCSVVIIPIVFNWKKTKRILHILAACPNCPADHGTCYEPNVCTWVQYERSINVFRGRAIRTYVWAVVYISIRQTLPFSKKSVSSSKLKN